MQLLLRKRGCLVWGIWVESLFLGHSFLFGKISMVSIDFSKYASVVLCSYVVIQITYWIGKGSIIVISINDMHHLN